MADIAPVAYDHDQTRHIHAMRALDLTGVTTRGEADRRLAERIEDPGLRAFFLQSLDLRATHTNGSCPVRAVGDEVAGALGVREPAPGSEDSAD